MILVKRPDFIVMRGANQDAVQFTLAAFRRAGLSSLAIDAEPLRALRKPSDARKDIMLKTPPKSLVFVVLLVLAGLAAFFALRRTPACSGGAMYMSNVSECKAWGVDEAGCKAAVDTARAVAVRVAPRSESLFACEVRFSDCFEHADGGFYPRPSFCLSAADKSAAPSEVRYLEYVSDRQNRKKTREVPIK
jgi:hypothetical protein